jgi:GAF domain-containing protein
MKDATYFERVIRGLREAAEKSRLEPNPEGAVRHITHRAWVVLGDPDAGKRPGGLKPGERDFKVSGIFFVAPRRDQLMLMAEHEFPVEQHRLRISITDSRPGYTARTGEPIVVSNTDDDPMFRQILKTARMGSAVFVPLVWQSEVLGVLNVAAQARNTYDTTDLEIAILFANLAAATWIALDGPNYLAAQIPAG